MSKEMKLVREGGGLRLEHLRKGSWKVSAVLGALLFLPAGLMGIPWMLEGSIKAVWALGGTLLLYGLVVAIFAGDSKGVVRVENGEFVVEGWGATRATGDRMRWEEVEVLEWTGKLYGVPGDDETVRPGLQAVSGERRICLAPDVSEEEGRRILEEILIVVPSLRGKVL